MEISPPPQIVAEKKNTAMTLTHKYDADAQKVGRGFIPGN
jgi:hypothetical protein